MPSAKSVRSAGRRPNSTAGDRRRGFDRQDLLNAAAELFARRGYRETSLEDIAARLTIKKTTLYHYIRAKEDLLFEIHGQMLDLLERRLAPIVAAPVQPDERLRRMIHAYIGIITANLDICAVYYMTAAMVMRTDATLTPQKLTSALRRGRALEKLFEGVIVEGQGRGMFRRLTPRLMVLAVLGMCEFVAYWNRFVHFPRDQIAAEFSLIIEAGLVDDQRKLRGAWPRPETVPEALSAAFAELATVRHGVEQVGASLIRAQQQLEQGLAEPAARGRRRKPLPT
ncbi:MAG TPA: TetR/AcrR family transcriptional regulator [Stellaceae bacterium]|nr:TetR/AcrR family transcriptional regulator [Stellaceae bacterium]